MKFAIIENEEYSRENLLRSIMAIRPDWKLIFTAETVDDSVSLLTQNKEIDLIFMDIELDDGSCFEIFDRIEVSSPIIFTTSYSDYAIKAFKVNSIDYILKPFDDSELLKAIIKFENYPHFIHESSEVGTVIKEISDRYPRKRLLIRNDDGYSYIRTEDIAWFEADDKYVSIITKDGNSKLTDIKSLSDIIKVLDPEEFFRVSRSIIASIQSIKKVSRHFKGRLTLRLQAGVRIKEDTISADRRPNFLDWLGHA